MGQRSDDAPDQRLAGIDGADMQQTLERERPVSWARAIVFKLRMNEAGWVMLDRTKSSSWMKILPPPALDSPTHDTAFRAG
jgi:hypothetical protein